MSIRKRLPRANPCPEYPGAIPESAALMPPLTEITVFTSNSAPDCCAAMEAGASGIAMASKVAETRVPVRTNRRIIETLQSQSE